MDEIADLATARASFTGTGDTSLYTGGETAAAYTNATEEFTAGTTNNTILYHNISSKNFRIKYTRMMMIQLKM